MKKNILFLFTFSILNIVNAKKNVDSFNNKIIKKIELKSNFINGIKLINLYNPYTCCTRTASSGTPNTNSWVRVSITKCLRGSGPDALNKACSWATGAANAALNASQEIESIENAID